MTSTKLKVFLPLTATAIVAGVVVSRRVGKAVRREGNQNRAGTFSPELEYLNAVNSAAPPQDPQLLFLLVAAFANANQPRLKVQSFSPRG